MRKTRLNVITRGHVAWFSITTIGAVVLCVWLMGINNQLPSFGSKYTVQAILPSSAFLAEDSRVTMAGVTVGRVTSIKRVGVGAKVELQIDDEQVAPIPADSRVTLRARTPLSENYIAVTPGTAAAKLESGATIPIQSTDEYVDVDEILSTLQGRTREQARKLLQGVGGALDGRGDRLNDLLRGGARTVTYGSHFMRMAAEERQSVRRVILQLGNLMADVSERDAAIREIGTQGLAALGAVADRDAAMRSILETLPPTLSKVRSTTQTLESVSQTAEPVVRNLTGALSDLRPAIVNLRPASEGLLGILRDLHAAAPGLTDTLDLVRDLDDPAVAALPQVTKTFCQVNPMLRYARPYTPDAVQTIIGLGSGTNTYDALSHTLRLAPTINDNSLVGAPKEVSEAAYLLLHTGLVGSAKGALTWDPYPKPGMVGTSTAAGKPAILGPQELAESGFRFPRIHADC